MWNSIVALAWCAAGGGAADASAWADAGRSAALDRVPVLIVTGQNNHDWQYTTPRIMEALERAGRFDLEVTEQPAKTFADAKALSRFGAIVLNYNGERWGEPAETNFLNVVKNGTGVTVIHAANNAFTDWVEYTKLVGDMWIKPTTGHGDYHAFDVKFTDHDHPITRGLPDMKAHPDELYHKLVRTAGVDVRVLATAFSAKEKRGTGENEPMVMVHEYGKGRVFHTPLGHVWPDTPDTRATWDDPALLVLVARGTEWAATGAVTIGTSLPAPPANQLTLAEQREGFRLLFDGKSTNGWRAYRGTAFPTKGWSVDGGALHAAKEGGGGDIVTADEYSDFELRFEWKVAPGSNSGVIYRTGESLDYPWQTGAEYQILDDALHGDGKNPLTSAASLYALYAPEGKTLKPVGEWNEGRIVARGSHVEHWLNGRKVVDATLGSDDWTTRLTASKFAPMKMFATLGKGRIDLQDHGDEVWYRSIRVRDLSPPPAPGK